MRALAKRFCDNFLFNMLLFKLIFLVATLFTAMPFVHDYLGRYIKILLAWGAVILLHDLLTKRLCVRNRYAGFFVLFIAAYAVTVLLNRQLNFSANFSQLAYMILFMFGFAAYDLQRNREEVKQELQLLVNAFQIVTFVLSLCCFSLFLFSVSYEYVLRTGPAAGSVVYLGVCENRLWGLYNANTGASLNMISCALSMMMLAAGSLPRGRKVFYWINLIVQYLCLILTLSRTSWYMFVVFCVLFVFFVWPRVAKPGAAATVLRTAAAVLAGLLVFFSTVPVKFVLSYAPVYIAELQEALEDPDPPSTTKPSRPELDREEENLPPDSGPFNGRTQLWKGGLKAFLDRPVFGTTRENLYTYAKDYIPEHWQANLLRGGLHNIAITVLVCSGAVGFVILAAFVILGGIRMLKAVWRHRCEQEFVMMNTLVILLLCVLGIEMFEARILYTVTVFSVLFWILTGYALCFTDMTEAEKAERQGLYSRLKRLAGRRSDSRSSV